MKLIEIAGRKYSALELGELLQVTTERVRQLNNLGLLEGRVLGLIKPLKPWGHKKLKAGMADGTKIEILKNCKICGEKITGKRYRTYCSKQCRDKRNNDKAYAWRLNWSRERRGRPEPGKIQCLICEKWYVQVCSHVVQEHKVTEEEYKREFDLPLQRGVTSDWLHALKKDYVFDNGTVKNLTKGAHKRYVKGDPRAKAVDGWKGRNGSKGFPGYEQSYEKDVK